MVPSSNTYDLAKRLPAPAEKEKAQAYVGGLSYKGNQDIKDIPQSVTVVTEKLIDDRNLDTMKEVLKTTGGISFLAAIDALGDRRRA